MIEGYYYNISLERIKGAGYEPIGIPSLIQDTYQIWELKKEGKLQNRAEEALKTCNDDLEGLIGFAIFHKGNTLNAPKPQMDHAIVIGLRKIENPQKL